MRYRPVGLLLWGLLVLCSGCELFQLKKSCASGDRLKCQEVGAALAKSGDPAGARRYHEEACKLGSAAGCVSVAIVCQKEGDAECMYTNMVKGCAYGSDYPCEWLTAQVEKCGEPSSCLEVSNILARAHAALEQGADRVEPTLFKINDGLCHRNKVDAACYNVSMSLLRLRSKDYQEINVHLELACYMKNRDGCTRWLKELNEACEAGATDQCLRQARLLLEENPIVTVDLVKGRERVVELCREGKHEKSCDYCKTVPGCSPLLTKGR